MRSSRIMPTLGVHYRALAKINFSVYQFMSKVTFNILPSHIRYLLVLNIFKFIMGKLRTQNVKHTFM